MSTKEDKTCKVGPEDIRSGPGVRAGNPEEALQGAEGYSRYFFNTMSDPALILDTGFTILQANKALLHVLGMEARDVLGRPCYSLICGTEGPMEDCPLQQMLLHGGEHSAEIFNERLGGHVLVKVTPMFDERGKLVGSLLVSRDINDLKRTERELQELNDEYERIFNGTQDSVFLVEVLGPGKFRYIRNNLAHQKATGVSLMELQGKTPEEILGAEEGARISAIYSHCVEAEAPLAYEETVNLPGGERTWSTTLTPVFQNGRAAFIVGSSRDVTKRKQTEERLRFLATTNDLTGLWNRRHFIYILESEIERVQRYGLSLSVMMLDIDHFKAINDRYGHAVGDRVLEHFAAVIRKHLRQVDVPGRLGGEEFAVILPQTNAPGARAMAERLRTNIETHPAPAGEMDIPFTVSIGVVTCGKETATMERILKLVDDALYEAKRSGRNRTVVGSA